MLKNPPRAPSLLLAAAFAALLLASPALARSDKPDEGRGRDDHAPSETTGSVGRTRRRN